MPMAFARVDESPTLLNAMSRRLVWHCRRGTSRKFYTLSVERDLWGDRAVVRRWGRMDVTRAAEAIDWDPDVSFAEVAREVHQCRRWHRYELVQGRAPE